MTVYYDAQTVLAKILQLQGQRMELFRKLDRHTRSRQDLQRYLDAAETAAAQESLREVKAMYHAVDAELAVNQEQLDHWWKLMGMHVDIPPDANHAALATTG